jgi:filamentous hemagglutinin
VRRWPRLEAGITGALADVLTAAASTAAGAVAEGVSGAAAAVAGGS